MSLTQQTIADLLGVPRTSVTRTLKGLQRQGIVDIGYGHIAVLDRAALAAAPVAPTKQSPEALRSTGIIWQCSSWQRRLPNREITASGGPKWKLEQGEPEMRFKETFAATAAKAGSAAATAKEKAGEAAASAKEKAGEAATSAKVKAHDAAEKAGDAAVTASKAVGRAAVDAATSDAVKHVAEAARDAATSDLAKQVAGAARDAALSSAGEFVLSAATGNYVGCGKIVAQELVKATAKNAAKKAGQAAVAEIGKAAVEAARANKVKPEATGDTVEATPTLLDPVDA